MSKDKEYCLNHESETLCKGCGLEVDRYGNTEDSFENCSYPDCGCAGERLCMAPSGPNYASRSLNLEKGSRAKFYDQLN